MKTGGWRRHSTTNATIFYITSILPALALEQLAQCDTVAEFKACLAVVPDDRSLHRARRPSLFQRGLAASTRKTAEPFNGVTSFRVRSHDSPPISAHQSE
jgi:hypothetical protein